MGKLIRTYITKIETNKQIQYKKTRRALQTFGLEVQVAQKKANNSKSSRRKLEAGGSTYKTRPSNYIG